MRGIAAEEVPALRPLVVEDGAAPPQHKCVTFPRVPIPF